jgi:hypothetical protein
MSRGQCDGSLRSYSWFSRPEPIHSLPSSSSVVLTRLSGPRSRLKLLGISGSAGESNPNINVVYSEIQFFSYHSITVSYTAVISRIHASNCFL